MNRPDDDDDEEEMADNFIEFDAAGSGSGSGHVKGLPEIITPQPIDDDDLVILESVITSFFAFISKVRRFQGSGCSTVVEHMPGEQNS